MNSNVEQVPNAGAQAMAEEALLKEIGLRAPSSTQAVKVCQILNLATRENIRRVRDFAKNKNSIASKAEGPKQKQEEKEMEVQWGSKRSLNKVKKLAENIFNGRGLHVSNRSDAIAFSESENFQYPNMVMSITISRFDIYNGGDRNFYVDGRWNDIIIKIFRYRPLYLNLAKRFADGYEKLSGKKVTILKEY